MKKLIGLLFISISLQLTAQQKHLNIDDAVLGYYKGLYPKSLRALQWVSDTDNYSYMDAGAYLIKDVNKNELKKISLDDLQKSYPQLKRLPYFQTITGRVAVFQTADAFEVYDYKQNKSEASIAYPKDAANQEYCATNNAVAYTVANNLYVSTSNQSDIPVTAIKDKNIVSGQAIHRSEFGITKGTFWSPKGNYLAFYQKDESNVSNYPLVDITTYPASLKNIKYPMAGQGSEQAKIGIFNMHTHQTSYLDIDTSDEHYLTNLAWSPDEKYITLAEVNRGQNHMWFNYYDVATGKKVKTLFEETNDKWVEPETPALFVPNSNTTFLWLSERDGFMNVYQYDLVSDKTRQVTDFKFVVTQILGFGTNGKYLYVEATGTDPKSLQVYQVNLKNLKYKQITKDGGTHRTQLSHSGAYLIDNYSSLTTPRKQAIIHIKDKECDVLLEAENPLKEYAVGTTEFVKLKAKNGMDLEARIIKPADFDPNKKYPVLVYVYGGPHAQLVTDTWMGGASLWMEYMATEKEYLIFTVDGRGSEHRGFAFESGIYRNQGGVNMEDQMTGVAYLKSLPYVDTDRLAIHGWSYGGFMTISMMLRHPGVFTTAVAGGPVTDWKYYEVMYGERYMDTPQENPEGYENTRLHKYIKNLDGNLLIIHGSIDDTVVPQHSMTLLKAAVDNGVQLDFFTYPMHPHNVRGKDRVHLMEKVIRYIVKNNK